MALSPDPAEAFVREVNEDLRRDQAEQFFKKNMPLIVGGLLLLFAAIAGWFYWQDRQAKAAAVDSERLSAAMDQIAANRLPAASTQLAPLADSSSDGVATQAKLTQAIVALEQGKRPAAVSIYRELSQDKGLAQPYRDLALVRLTALEFDMIKADEVIARMEPLAKPGNPWFGSAGELRAMAMLKAGRRAEAGQLFAAIAADRQAPPTIRSRAVQIAATLGVDASAALPDLSR